MSTQYPAAPQEPAPQAPQPIIINNNVAASAAATAVAGYGLRGRRRQSGVVHLWLFLLTAGIGNIIYAWYISDWNKKRGL
ncbi:hypothetical protein [Streptomyces beijiangensis]|uniref:DUF8108 domain-containing protein n=1 Tax=Streptomyces beijiangensis TaxID=163361 RepID=A0A939F7K2_9ACTN|nr:hypothetical protein [Streptomyces beijiangensis]MBO0512412.1 hypothetical protein [Streptomyces beijiangensis]